MLAVVCRHAPDWDTVRRHTIVPRPDHRQILGQHGVPDNGYWNEAACYELELAQVGQLSRATEELHSMCLAAAHHAVRDDRVAELGIPDWAAAGVVESLEAQPPTLLGHIDLWYDGTGDPRFLAYRAEDLTGLLETSVAQWFWVEQVRPGDDQCNILHRRLVEAWEIGSRKLASDLIHLAWSPDEPTGIDEATIGYLAETAQQAGLHTPRVPITSIGWNGKRFLDADGAPIDTCFKLYPWEWMLDEPYGRLALEHQGTTAWVEPVWKAMLSSPALPALLWELYPDHPNLLPVGPDGRPEVPPLPEFDGCRVVVSSWVVTAGGGRATAAGAGFIEYDGRRPTFVPHFVPKS